MPIVSVWVMPAGLLALLAHAVRPRRAAVAADGARHRLDDLRSRCSSRACRARSGASWRSAPGRCCCARAGLLLLCLLRSPLRWCGAVVIAAAAFWAFRAPVPDVYVGDRGDVVAVRGASGRLSVMRTAATATPSRCANGSRADADARTPADPSLQGWRDLRRDRLRRAAARRRDRGAAVRRGSLRGGLPPRRARRQPAHRAAVVRRDCHRPHGLAAHGRGGALPDRKRVGEGGRLSGRLRPAVGARRRQREARAKQRADAQRRAMRRRGREDPQRRTIEQRAQYFRNKPTSLPCTRTRLGGRMRTS